MNKKYVNADEDNSKMILFDCAEEAWFWYCKYEVKTPYKSNCSNIVVERPCVVDDIYLAVLKLYFAKKISERHVKTLIKYGRKLCPPDYRIVAEAEEAIWWDDAMDKLETLLISKGVVRCKDVE